MIGRAEGTTRGTADAASTAAGRSQAGPVVLATTVGDATGARPAAAALACAASEPDRAALLIDLSAARPPRPSLIATAGARGLEERLASHMPEAAIASRGRFCQLTVPPDPDGLERLPTALPLVRESAAVVHLPPALWTEALAHPRIPAGAALLRADLARDRPLTALIVRDLLDRDLRVAVLKCALAWLPARTALLGALPADTSALPAGARRRLLSTEDNRFQQCYDDKDGAEHGQGQLQGRDRELGGAEQGRKTAYPREQEK
ncbi:MAG TPA: hypothetical protein VIS95_01225 [Solirubrobacterales bacterium]